MRTIFDLDGPFLSGLNKFADLIIINIIYLICCIPIFTIGVATTALYYVMLKMAKNEECYVVKSYFKSFKDNFKQATGIWMLLLVTVLILYFDLKITNGEFAGTFAFDDNMKRILLVVLMLALFLWAIVTAYVFPVLSKFDNTVKNTLRNAFFMGLRHLPWTFVILIINIIPWLILYVAPNAVIIVLISCSLCAFGCSFIFNRIFKLYIPEEVQTIKSDEQFFINPDQESFLFKNTADSEDNSDSTIKEDTTNE